MNWQVFFYSIAALCGLGMVFIITALLDGDVVDRRSACTGFFLLGFICAVFIGLAVPS